MADTHYCTGCGERMDISVWPTATFHEGCPNDGMWKPLEELQEARSAATASFDRVEIIGRLRAVESGELTLLERHLIEALEHIAAVPEWWQGKVAREALAHV